MCHNFMMHAGTCAEDEGYSKQFLVAYGVIAGPTLFSIIFSSILANAFHDCETISYRFNGKLFQSKKVASQI